MTPERFFFILTSMTKATSHSWALLAVAWASGARAVPSRPPPLSGLALGIDLGDHSSVVASVDGKCGTQVLVNRIGGRQTPSAVVFGARERSCGEKTAGGLLGRSPGRSMTMPRKLLGLHGRGQDTSLSLGPEGPTLDAVAQVGTALASAYLLFKAPRCQKMNPNCPFNKKVSPLLTHLWATAAHALGEAGAWERPGAAVVR